MKTFLVPIDFSANSLAAANYAVNLAESMKAGVELFHVFMVNDPDKKSALSSIIYGSGEVREIVDRKLFNIAKKAIGKVKISYSTGEGIAAAAILARAKELKADFIAVGLHGRNNALKPFSGRTTATLIRNAPCKVLAVPQGVKFKSWKRIIFTTDLRNDNLSFAKPAAAIAKHFGAELIFLFVDSKFMIHSDEEIAEMTTKMCSRTNYKNIAGYVCAGMGLREGVNYFLRHKKADAVAMVTRHHAPPGSPWKKTSSVKVAKHIRLPLLVFEKTK
ncbi:MAG TPA: universal stress protein [Bacteroidia bacterium]|jgi:nucleotide-binding universal stress UspA family protein